MSDTSHDHEIVSIYGFSDAQREQLLNDASECVLNWATQDCWPVGVVHSFVWKYGKLWITFAAHRHRAAAIRRNPKVSVVISSVSSRKPGTPRGSITVKGRGVLHEDQLTKDWFYPALGEKSSTTPEGAVAFAKMLDSPLRVILEVTPEKYITFDSDKSAKDMAGTLTEEEMTPRQSADRERMNRERAKRGLPPR